MIEAKSMYWAGEIVAAHDCTSFEDPKRLGLICPFCSEALFLNSGGVRMRNKRTQFISPHFCHYKTGTDAFDCEKRALTKEGRERIIAHKIEARNQRLKLYNNYLWDMAAEDRNITSQRIGRFASWCGRKWIENAAIETHRMWAVSLDSVYTFMAETLQEQIDGIPPKLAAFYEDIELAEQAAYQSNYFAYQVNQKQHLAVCFEIADFLATKSSGYAFSKIFKASLIPVATLMRLGTPEKLHKEMSPGERICAVAGFIGGTHWLEQINARLNKEK